MENKSARSSYISATKPITAPATFWTPCHSVSHLSKSISTNLYPWRQRAFVTTHIHRWPLLRVGSNMNSTAFLFALLLTLLSSSSRPNTKNTDSTMDPRPTPHYYIINHHPSHQPQNVYQIKVNPNPISTYLTAPNLKTPLGLVVFFLGVSLRGKWSEESKRI